MAKNKTHDEINIDLDGSIDGAIQKLKALKKEYPDGEVSLETDYEYGESYARLKLRFSRPKTEAEIELEVWKEKLGRFQKLRDGAKAYEREGDVYPREQELTALRNELGCFADRMASLAIFDGEVVAYGFEGARRRDGTWLFRSMLSHGLTV